MSEGQQRAGVVCMAGYFQLRLAPVAPSIDGTVAARWVMPPFACGCPLSHTAARQTVHTAAAAAARLTVCRAPPPTTAGGHHTHGGKQYAARLHTDRGGHIKRACSKETDVLMGLFDNRTSPHNGHFSQTELFLCLSRVHCSI